MTYLGKLVVIFVLNCIMFTDKAVELNEVTSTIHQDKNDEVQGISFAA